MLMERLFENLDLNVEPFAVCVLTDGWRLNLPGPDWVTLHFVLKGECQLLAGDADPLTMKTQSLAVVPPRLVHSIECGDAIEHEASAGGDAQSPCSLAQYSAGEADEFRAACGRVQVTYGGSLGLFDLMREAMVLDFSGDERMTRLFDDLIREEQNSSPGSRAMIAALMNQCLVTVFRRWEGLAQGQLPWLSPLEDPRLAAAMEKVLADPGQPHSLETLAEASGMSRSSFAERFVSVTGHTPMDFVRDVRIRRAGKLLRTTELSVDGVAARVGFASRSHFSQAFRDYFSQTPTEFRNS
jgi:AraC-like DNA-binding protein